MGRQHRQSEHHDVTSLVDDLLVRGLSAGATDLHFEPIDDGLLVRTRIDGQLVDLETLPKRLADNIVSRLKVLASLLTYRVDIPQEGSFVWAKEAAQPDTRPEEQPEKQPAEFRVATFPTIRGERAVVRIFRTAAELQSLGALGLSDDQVEQLRAAVALPAGFIVISGPAGSGKSTTLYAMIRELRDRFPGRSIITLEDPVEQRIDRIAQIQINSHGELNYERCLRSLLRHDPQVILLGEVRDRETASAAIEAALTGHLILTTVHSGDPAETVVRFLEMGIPPYQLTSALTLVCTQRLLRKKCGKCRQTSATSCDKCFGTGYAGRTAVAQLAHMQEIVRSMILRKAPAAELRLALKMQGPNLIERAGALVGGGVTDEDEVARVLGVGPAVDAMRTDCLPTVHHRANKESREHRAG